MRAVITAVVAAIEAAAVALAGLVVVALAGLLLWVVVFGLAAEPSAVVAGVAATWLLAHLIPLRFALDADAVAALGAAPEALDVTLSLAPLGLLLLTAALAMRAGWRFAARGGTGAAGVLGGFLGFGGVAFLAATFAQPFIEESPMRAAAVAAGCYAVAAAAAFFARAVNDGHDWWVAVVRSLQRAIEWIGLPGAARLPSRIVEAGRIALALVAAALGLAGLAFAVAVIAGYPNAIALTQGLHLDPLGSLLVFLVQLLLVPVAVLWALAWLVGVGFSVGEGTSATPFETLLGPLPSLPIFGLLPQQGWGDLGVLAPALLVLAGVAIGVAFARRAEARRSGWVAGLVVPLVAAALAGLVVVGLASLAGGSLGPDRLEVVGVVGAEAWRVGALFAAEAGGGLLLGTAAGRIDLRRVRDALPVLPLAGLGGGRSESGSAAAADPVLDSVLAAEASDTAGTADTEALSDTDIIGDAAPRSDAEPPLAPVTPLEVGGEARGEEAGVEAGMDGADASDAMLGDEFAETEAYETEQYATEPYDLEPYDVESEAGLVPDESGTSRAEAVDLDDDTGAGVAYGGAAPDSEPEAPEEELDEAEAERLLREYSWDALPASAADPDETPDPGKTGDSGQIWPWRRGR